MKGGSRSVSRRMVVAFFVLLYRAQPNNTVFWNQKTIPKLFRPPLFNTGHLRFYLPEICPGCPGNGVRNFVNRKPLKRGCFSPLLEPPPVFSKATGLLNTFRRFFYKLNQIPGLAVQQIADGFQHRPRYYLSGADFL